ncbi:MAG: hypothetical protein HQK49_15330 [Oligoflexia bacterium]|nr:hypothetical protein [Oligoflexia bacterium]
MKKFFNYFKRGMVVITLATALQFTTVPAANNANAGIILSPVGVGIYLIIIGAIQHNWWLILLNENGKTNDQLEVAITNTYPQINDQEAVNDLAALVRTKLSNQNVSVLNDSDKINISLTKDEILNVFAPTGLLESNPELINKIVVDFK